MLVKYWMRKDVTVVGAHDSLQEATRLMKENSTPILPVLRKGKLVGVVTDRDVKRASASDAITLDVHELAYLLSKIKVSEIMTSGAITIPQDFTLEEAATILLENNISGAPVLDSAGEITGIISQREIFEALVSMSGLRNKGVQFAFEIEDRPGSIKEITDVIRKYDGRLVSILSSYDRAAEGRRKVYIRAHLIDRECMPQLRDELKQKGNILYIVDHREGLREEYEEDHIIQGATVPHKPVEPLFRRILVCTDFSENSLPARDKALALARSFGSELMLLHVVNPRLLGYPAFDDHIPIDWTDIQRSIDEIVRENLDQSLSECRKVVPETTAHLCSGEPAVEIVPFAKKHNVDLIVMGTHGWTGFKHLILGSTAENVVRTAHCPVLTVRSSMRPRDRS